MDLRTYLDEKRALVNQALERTFPKAQGYAGEVIEAMSYSLFAGGKRLRAILCIAGAELVGGDGARVLPIACALEYIHTYSLIHDDLPVMDDDDMRRGRPTNHKVFGEAVALLAGDGLLTEAFHMMTDREALKVTSPDCLIRIINLIASAAGYRGMVGGQVADIQSEGKQIEADELEYIHSHKTGALIMASVSSGTIAAGGGENQIEAVTAYGKMAGLAFQVADDILDIEGDSQELGKGVGADERKEKSTYPSIFGLERSRRLQTEMVEQAIEALKPFDHRADPLRHIARYIIERKK